MSKNKSFTSAKSGMIILAGIKSNNPLTQGLQDFELNEAASMAEVENLNSMLHVDCVLLDMDLNHSLRIVEKLSKMGLVVITLSKDGTEDELMIPIEHGSQENLVKKNITSTILRRVINTVIERHKLLSIANNAVHALKESEARFRDIADRIENGLWVRSADGSKCLYLNPAFESIWGRTIEEMNQIAWSDTIHPDDVSLTYSQYLIHRATNKDYTLEYRIIRPDGSIRYIENKAYSILDEEGNKVRMAGIVRDITLHRRMEAELRLAQKLEGLGQISAGVAHEINTPSQYVSDNISFLGDSLKELANLIVEIPKLQELANQNSGPNEELERINEVINIADLDYLMEEIPLALEQSKNGMDQIKKIVLAMKGFSHPGESLTSSDINKCISTTMTVAKNEWKYVAEIVTNFEAQLPLVQCVPSAINQVILNMIVNAAHAIGDKINKGELGVITISTYSESDNVFIKIEDTGNGISEANLEKIFDPFFTTKEVGKGTGQGLAIAHKVICDDHHGELCVSSIPKEGTCFTISLPIQQPLTRSKEAA